VVSVSLFKGARSEIQAGESAFHLALKNCFMNTLILNRQEVYQLLPMSECMEVMAAALQSLARGEVVLPLRPLMRLPEQKGLMGLMPSYSATLDAMGLKVITIFHGNAGGGRDSHQGAVLLFDAGHGGLRAIMDAAAITAIRTAAVSGVATRALACDEAHVLALLGSGVQAQTHLEAMRLARNVTHVRVWSRNFEHALRFVQRNANPVYEIKACEHAQQTVADADLICTVTSSAEPVLKGEWLKPGAHLNVVGSSTPAAREVDTAAMLRSRLYVDRRESALNEAGDFLIPKQEGAIGDAHMIGELGDVLLEKVAGRTSAEEITLFKSLGLGIEDLAAAQFVYEKAIAQNIGAWVEI
jgi:ornithine cyclodeaminase